MSNLNRIWLFWRILRCWAFVHNAHVIGLPQESTPGLTRGKCRGIQGDGMGSLPLGRGKIQEIVSVSMNWGGGIRNIVESWSATTGISREHLRPARREKTQIAHGLPFPSFRPAVLRYVSLTVLTAHGWNQISLFVN